ncbi:hypothetical protein [Pectobacterium brasiliense]|uniref:hypothetical protein n=1 Tax=Pectobacterium brasiliense TaxID=180957 RepID=UPI000689618F|nr:hypothetical protein [Pectobacterium brasiliense]
MTDLLSKEAIMAVADLKTGYHLGHADILILKGISQELMRRREAADKPFAYARRLVRIADGGVERWRITQTEAENSEGLLYRNEITKLFAEPPITSAEREELQRYRAAIDKPIGEVDQDNGSVTWFTAVPAGALVYSIPPQPLVSMLGEIDMAELRREVENVSRGQIIVTKAAPPLPVVPDEITYEQACLEVSGLSPAEAYMKAWSVHAAMLQLSGNSEQVNSPALPDGWALVPKEIHLDANKIEFIAQQCGDGDHMYGDYTSGILWIGEVDYDGKPIYGLHISSGDYPEEGCLTLAEFSTAPQPSKGDA